ncbi:hypothetical protein [Natranaerobius thermophilus]|uniref:General stress protein 17M-like domain-containing protein n=1 Tax=Natranaerobius thermophilus (strain ATCC BAA-1301 / DSM 18059 / JW/NM-WN-LF) TaxID=457570 RepID=B2A2C7_NATTJ|nr:hypothetical protein [Natranaerobius thermophilus]ACB86233.1 hypothetical protein Nther_2678 [Natranaerobius thermophilus JW/NM-WN-LF]
MRVVGRFPDRQQASFAIKSLRETGLDRKDMIVSQVNTKNFNEEEHDVPYLQSEREGLGEMEDFSSGIEGLKGQDGIVVAVEVSKNDRHRIRELMEQSGALEIVED